MKELSQAGREELALALILWKDFKAQGKFDLEIFQQMMGLAAHIGVAKEVDDLLTKIPPLEIKPREF